MKVGPMFDELRTRALVLKAACSRSSLTGLAGLFLVQILSGCMFGTERPDLALSASPGYRATRGDVHAAVPALDWWRGFRSAELTRFIEEAQTESFDIGAAIGRILQADAQSKIASAPLLPAAAFAGTGARLKGAGLPERGDYRVVLNAAYEMDFWGKNRAMP